MKHCAWETGHTAWDSEIDLLASLIKLDESRSALRVDLRSPAIQVYQTCIK